MVNYSKGKVKAIRTNRFLLNLHTKNQKIFAAKNICGSEGRGLNH